MKYSVLLLAFLLSSCYSYSVYEPSLEHTEAEVNVVFDREGFRGIQGWAWQVGTLSFEYDRYKKWTVYGWPGEVDMLEDWMYIIGGSQGPRIKSPYHETR